MTPTFVLVHGSNGNGRYYAPLQRELALLGHRSLAVDLPGHGNGGGFSAAFQAQDLAAFAEEPSPLAGVTHADGVAHVIDVVRRAREHGPVVLATLKRALLADGTDSEFYAFLATLEPDECLDAGTDRAEADTWGRVPHSYVRLTGDQSIPIALQDRFIAEADALTPANPFDVHSLDSGHLRALLRPSELAGILAESVTRRSTSPAG